MPVTGFPCFHRFQENVLQRIALIVEAADLDRVSLRQFIEISNFDGLRKNHLDAMRSLVDSAVTAEPLGRFEETAILAAGFNLQELAIGAPLLFEIAVVRDAPV